MKRTILVLFAVLSLVAAACGNDTSTTAEQPDTTEAPDTTDAPDTTQAPTVDDDDDGPMRTIEATSVDGIVIDGDASDWDGVAGLDVTLEGITGESVEAHPATLKVAHDGENVLMLLQVEDDYDWNPDDAHLSAANAIQWAIEPDAAEHMGAEDDDREGSFGMVDIWHWELDCSAGRQSGGAVSDAGEGKDLGNDANCNFDDEWATNPTTREDDNGDTAENSLLGVWTHTASTIGEDGTWTFEMQRPMQTGDAQDAQFSVGSTARLAVAYWDADNGPDGWDDDEHVQSANQGWIEVVFS